MKVEQQQLMPYLEWIVNIDPVAITASVQRYKEKYPNLNKQELVEKCFAEDRLKASMIGIVTGLPASLWTALPAAMTDVVLTLKTEVNAVAKAAVIYDANFFDNSSSRWELLIPVFGLKQLQQINKEIGLRSGTSLTRTILRKWLSTHTLPGFKQTLLKYFSLKLAQKGMMSKTIPIIAGIIGGGWNYVEVNRIKNRSITYFSDHTQRFNHAIN